MMFQEYLENQLVSERSLQIDIAVTAKEASLRYVSDHMKGIHRRRAGRAFSYRTASGETVTDPATLARIRKLAIPPAWNSVWICASANGHLRATGIDARGHKQYRYRGGWRALRDETKYNRMV